MPYHRTTRADLEAKLAELAENNETVTAACSDDNGLDLFTTAEKVTRRKAGQEETR